MKEYQDVYLYCNNKYQNRKKTTKSLFLKWLDSF